MQFRTKARAIDLLGKGQIADLPTAITELWKNGYDAYADNVSLTLFLKGYKQCPSSYLVISDDGIGMSKKDIFDKWLVLGTDSKSRDSKQDEVGEDTLGKEPRIKAGEKGIGRLSVAYLGTPMLMLTKKKDGPLLAMLIDWRILENYNMFIEDVNIPVEEIDDLTEIRTSFDMMRNTLENNLSWSRGDRDGVRFVWDESQRSLRDQIEHDLEELTLPSFFEEKVLAEFKDNDSHGTKFFIFNPEQQIIDVVSGIEDEDNMADSSSVRTSLVGFTNTFKEQRLVDSKIVIYKADNEFPIDFLNEQGLFFESGDYELADIVIEGDLDGSGGFSGILTIYDMQAPYKFQSPRRFTKTSFYGKCPIKLGYSMGFLKDSKLNAELFERINKKVDKYGGIYIYRDGFRVLPYGRADADFLKLEERRNTRIGTYFFSYRRMFGYIEISRQTNKELKDKSSREGFINNAPYRAFKADLAALFIDLANTYFNDKAKEKTFLQKKEELNKEAQIIKEDKAREKNERKAFTAALKQFSSEFDTCRKEYEQLLNELEDKIDQSNLIFSDIEGILDQLHQVELQINKLLPRKPKRYKITDSQEEKLSECSSTINEFFNEIAPRRSLLTDKVHNKFELRDLRKSFEDTCRGYRSSLNKLIKSASTTFADKTGTLSEELRGRTSRMLSDFDYARTHAEEKIESKSDVYKAEDLVKSVYDKLVEEYYSTISPLVEHFNRMGFDFDEENLQGAYKEQYENIKKQWELVKETSQLGISVEIIDHEFRVLYGQINSAIDAINNGSLLDNSREFSYLQKSFRALEDKYALLSPLYRISGSIAKDIRGKSVKDYMISFFENKLKNEEVTLSSTTEFDELVIHLKEPILYTVFINVINNALYWLRNANRKEIELAYKKDTKEIIIRNSGKPILDSRLERIFELFYSNRPNGRGIGLYLAKQSLNDNYFDIYATNDPQYNTLKGACFVIKIN